jgi:group I intron endonuclease
MQDNKKSGIYKITSPSNKIYIGASVNIEKRIKYYQSNNCIGQTKLFNSIKKYGWQNHKFEVLEYCSLNELREKENYYGHLFNCLSENGLNSILPKNNDKKVCVSDDTRKLMSLSKKGSKNTFYGKKHTDDAKLKMSNYRKGKTLSDETKLKVSKNNGKGMSKTVVDLSTGVFYSSCREAAISHSINHSTLKSMLNNNNPNRTNLRYC